MLEKIKANGEINVKIEIQLKFILEQFPIVFCKVNLVVLLIMECFISMNPKGLVIL